MRGLIYKDICLFFKSIHKFVLLIAGGMIVFIFVKLGEAAGLLVSILFAMTVSSQFILCFASDEKANWKKYELSLPVSGQKAVASKYLSAVCLLAVGLAGSLLFNLFASVLYGTWNLTIWMISAAVSVLIPLAWIGLCLPLTYWFGFRASQIMALLCIFPVVRLINYFEDGSGVSAPPPAVPSYLGIAAAAVIVIYGVSYLISVIGYRRKKIR